VEDELPAGGRGVDVLLEALKADARVFEVSHELDEVLERAPQAIQPPGDQHVPLSQELPHPVEPGALRLLPAGHIHDDLLAPRFLEGVLLEVEVLFVGRDPGVTDPHDDGWPLSKRAAVCKETRRVALFPYIDFFHDFLYRKKQGKRRL